MVITRTRTEAQLGRTRPRTSNDSAIGTCLGGRFQLLQLVDIGGMGAIYRGRDRRTALPVAIKLVAPGASARSHDALLNEARALIRCARTGIVEHIDHGVSAELGPYLVMNWLEGESLEAHICRSALSVDDTLNLGIALAPILARVHARGLVHRDVKPENVILEQRALTRPRIIDFGLVHDMSRDRHLPSSFRVVGTPGFLAPEQARGDSDIDQRVDVYGLGALLYTCLAQRPPIGGGHVLAVLTRVLLEDPLPVHEIRCDVPAAVGEFLASMVARDVEDRPGDMHEVHEGLSRLARSTYRQARAATAGPAISSAEQRIVSVLMVEPPAAAERRRTKAPELQAALAAIAESHRGQLQMLADGTLVITFSGEQMPQEMALRAALCARAIAPQVPERAIAIATGQVLLRGQANANRAPVGAVIDRAVTMLLGLSDTVDIDRLAAPAPVDERYPITVDHTTAELIQTRFHVQDAGREHYRLLDARVCPEHRRLLGRQTRCVGRERELSMLRRLHDTCSLEQRAQVLLLTGPAGVGKSRLVDEFVRQSRARVRTPAVWIGHGDVGSPGAPFGPLGQLLKQAIPAFDHPSPRLAQVRSELRSVVGPQAHRIALFLGELLGLDWSDDGEPLLRAARADHRLMHAHMRRAWLDWLTAVVDERPVIMIVEDMHWSDAATARFLDAALYRLQDRALMLVGLARPEVHERLPGLWAQRGVRHLELQPLSHAACGDLIQQVLGERVPFARVAELSQLAQGNPFVLEELLRQVARAPTREAPPESILALVETRLARLQPAVRRALRGASVFGRIFWKSGLEALLGDTVDALMLPMILHELTEQEFIVPRASNHHESGEEYAFAHDLTREAAYHTLLESDRVRGHARAGAWLEEAGHIDALALAEHFDRGQRPERAVTWYARAAAQALRADDLGEAVALAQRGHGCGAAGIDAGQLHLLQAEALNWSGDPQSAAGHAEAACRVLPEGSDAWANAIHHASWAASARGDFVRVRSLVERGAALMGAQPSQPYLAAMALCAGQLAVGGDYERAAEIAALLDDAARAGQSTQTTAATISRMHGFLAIIDERPDAALAAMLQAARSWEAVGHTRNACMDRSNAGHLQLELGDYRGAVATLRTVVADMSHTDGRDLVGLHEANLAMALARHDQLPAAEAALRRFLASEHVPRTTALGHIFLAHVLALQGGYREAATEAESARVMAREFPSLEAHAWAVIALIELRRGRVAPALASAERGMRTLATIGSLMEGGESLLRLVHAQALRETGREAEARRCIGQAADRLRRQAERIHDPQKRRSYLQRVAEHEQTLACEERWNREDT